MARLLSYAAPILFVAVAGFLYLRSGEETPGLASGLVQVAGSETLHPAVSACAEEFMTVSPDADIVVTGGGSGDGIAALLHGMIDVAMISRDLAGRERDFAASSGIELTTFPLARDGIAIVANSTNDVAALSVAELQKIFAGAIRNWRDVGGAEKEIEVFARAAGSGTASLFEERVMAGRPYPPTAQLLPTNEAIVAEVKQRLGAIGYTSLGALRSAGDEVNVIALRAEDDSKPVAAVPAEISSGRYPLSRTLYLVAAGEPTGAVRAFVDFCSGQGGRSLIEKAGYVGIAQAAR